MPISYYDGLFSPYYPKINLEIDKNYYNYNNMRSEGLTDLNKTNITPINIDEPSTFLLYALSCEQYEKNCGHIINRNLSELKRQDIIELLNEKDEKITIRGNITSDHLRYD